MKKLTPDQILKAAIFLPLLVPIYAVYGCFIAVKALFEYQE